MNAQDNDQENNWAWRRIPSEMVKCPSCNLLIKKKAKKCDHCKHIFSEEEVAQFEQKLVKETRKNSLWGGFVFIFLFLVLVLVFSA